MSEEVAAPTAIADAKKRRRHEPLSIWKIKTKEGDEWPIPYPAIIPYEEKLDDGVLERELNKLVRKTHADPSFRPTRRGARRCVTNWLEKAIEFTQHKARP